MCLYNKPNLVRRLLNSKKDTFTFYKVLSVGLPRTETEYAKAMA